MNQQPTYVIVINSLGAGGAERSLADILPHLRERGVRPVVVCFKSPEEGFEREVRAAGTEVVVLPSKGIVGHIRQLRRIIRKERPQLVYTALFDAHLVGRLAAVGSGVPVLSNLTNVAYDPARYADPNVSARKLSILRVIDGWTARRLTKHFHAVSGAVRDSAVEWLGISPEAVSVIYRGRSRDRLGHPGPERRMRTRSVLGIAADAPVLITVGRQEYQKGQRYLLESIPALLEQWPELVVLMVGRQGHSSSQLSRIVDELGLEEVVQFLGHRSDVADLLAGADVFVFPSVYEGLGGATLEAMALGLPMVVSDIPALREVVTKDGNGLLVAPGDPAALAGAIGRLLAEPETRSRFGARSIEIFEERFVATDAIPRSVDLMVQVAADGR